MSNEGNFQSRIGVWQLYTMRSEEQYQELYVIGWSLKKVVYLQVEIERYSGKINFPVQKILNNARLQKNILVQK